MAEGETSGYVVCTDHKPVMVRINGKANYLNCAPVNEFFDHMLASGVSTFMIDFSACLGMDSTFLGVLAGVATKTMRHAPPGKVLLANMSIQNKQLIRGLGLHHLPTVQIEDDVKIAADGAMIGHEGRGEASAGMILEAHERLMKLNVANERRFQDVVKFLRREAEKEGRTKEE
jgi:anti-anti-sigma regulatory factor